MCQMLKRRQWIAVAFFAMTAVAIAQTPPPPDQPPPPLVIGRDPGEPLEVIGKNFLLRVWISNVGGPGMQRIYSVRVAADGTVIIPGVVPVKAEGIPIAALEQQVTALLKPASPQATVWITILDRSSPPPASQPAIQPAAATTKPATAPTK